MTSTLSITSRPVYSYRKDIRRFFIDGLCVGMMQPGQVSGTVVYFTRPQSADLPWTEFHTPAILASCSFEMSDVASAEWLAANWLEEEYVAAYRGRGGQCHRGGHHHVRRGGEVAGR